MKKVFNVCTIDEAKKLISDKFSNYEIDSEEVKLFESLNRYLAKPIFSKCDVPHFNRSTVDGYALMSKDVVGASESLPAFLKIVGEVEMGYDAKTNINHGEAIYVPTGGVLPTGADCVVMIEDTDQLNGDDLFVYTKLAPKENVLFKGEDIKIGEQVLDRGSLIGPQDLGVLASIGYETVEVYKKLKFTVISTGDEVVSPNVTPKIGEIRDINSYTISGVILERNGYLVDFCVLRDQEGILKTTIINAITKSDIVIISGGSSVGNKDFTHKLLNEIESDSVFVHGIAIKPGKPSIFAKVRDKLIVGLPGQPASALIVFKTFIDHIEQVLIGSKAKPVFYIEATLTKNVHSTPGRETYQMVKIISTLQGYLAEPIYGKSGTITLIANALGFIKISANCEGLSADEIVKVYEL